MIQGYDCLLVEGLTSLEHSKRDLLDNSFFQLDVALEEDLTLSNHVEVSVCLITLAHHHLLKDAGLLAY